MTAVWLVVGALIGAAIATAVMSARQRSNSPVTSCDDLGIAREQLVAADTRNLRLQQALDALPVGVVVADNHARVVLRNSSADSLGAASNAHVLVHAAVQQQLRQAIRGTEQSETIELSGPPRQVMVVTARPLETDGALATIEDITERLRVDAVRTDFVANISHELKTPIGALAVLAETLIDETDPAVIRRLAGKTVNEAHRVARTVDDLLELSQIELNGQLNVTAMDTAGLIGKAVARSRYLAERRSVIVSTPSLPSKFCIHGDPTQLESALGNLVENAVKYSETGDTVTVTAESAAAGVILQVSDNGIGIPAQDLDRIFERFYRVDRGRSRATGGTGLGLSIVRHVAQNHAGNVTVQSRVGEGSTFRLFIPSHPHLSGDRP